MTLPTSVAVGLHANDGEITDLQAVANAWLPSRWVSVLEFGTDATAFASGFAATSDILYAPAGTYKLGATGISVPTGKSLIGAGKQKTILTYSGSGSAITIDGCQASTVAELEVQVTGGTGTERGITITNATTGSQRNVIRNCYLLQANATARIAGQKGIYIVDVNGGGAAQYWNHIEGCDFLNWDVACHLQKNGGTNGANQNFLMRNFFSASLQHILIDGACNDNTVWGAHGTHSSASAFTDVLLTIGDGATVTGGNICVGIISDMGANGSAFNLTAASTINVVVAVNESSGSDVDAGSNNYCLNSKNLSGATQRCRIPSLQVTGVTGLVGNLSTGAALQLAKRHFVADADYTATTADFYIAFQTLTATRIVTLPSASAFSGGYLVLKDESGNAAAGVIIQGKAGTAGQSLDGTANPGTVNLINTAYGHAHLYSNGTNWFTV